MTTTRRALVVDDEPGIRFVLVRALRGAGLEAAEAGSRAEARHRLAQESFAAVFVDIRLPDGSGLDLVRELSRLDPRPLVVVMTAQDTVDNAIEAMKRGADEYLVKPFAVGDVQQLGRTAMARSGAAVTSTPQAHEPDAPFGLVGRSTVMREVYKRIGRVAATDLPVLLEGESGTGKEVVARAIHAASGRASGPFVAVNLAAIPSELLESELYGHERGAFTGAGAAREGQFERAAGGTLLLDEVGELPLPLQAKLLRALQEGEVARVGGRTTKVDVRVVAATNVDLARAVAAGTFRADLYYRLRVLPMRLPPLRERPEDVPLLAEWFVRRDGPRLRGREHRLSPDALELLARQPWPGNVRELENTLRSALVDAPETLVTTREIAGALHAVPPPHGANGDWRASFASSVRDGLDQPEPYARLLAEAERVVLSEAMQRCDGNQVKAAALLGLHRNSLRRRLEALGLMTDRGD
jgi:two-component system nitrogen regulation response regulator GlnG